MQLRFAGLGDSPPRRWIQWCRGGEGEVPGLALLAQDDEIQKIVIPESRSDIRDLPLSRFH